MCAAERIRVSIDAPISSVDTGRTQTAQGDLRHKRLVRRQPAFLKEVTMIEHDDRIGHVPSSYTPSSPHSAIAAVAQRATRNAGLRDKGSRDAGDLDRWEAEGGAGATRAGLQKQLFERPTTRAGMSARPSYDWPHRSAVEAMLGETAAETRVVASQGPADANEKRGKQLARSPGDAFASPPNKRRGRRTMGRHGNRP